MLRKFWSVLALVSIITTAPACHAEAIVVFGNEYKPPKILLKNNVPSGILVDILQSIGKETGQTFDIRLYPWKRALHLAVEGHGGIVSISMTRERLQLFDFSDPIYYDQILLVTKKGKEFHYESMMDLKGKTLGTPYGASYGDEFEAAKNVVFKIDEDSTSIQRLKKLLAGRIDVALINPGYAALLKTLHDDPELSARASEFAVLEHPFRNDPNYLAFPKSMHMQVFLSKFNQALHNAEKQGVIQKIIDSYQND